MSSGSKTRAGAGRRLAPIGILAAALLAPTLWGCGESGTASAPPAPAPVVAAPAPEPSQARPETASPAAPDARRFGLAEPRPRTPGAIRLATYNFLNLFDAIDDPAYSGRQEDLDDAKPEAELRALAETIRRLDADVLAVQEIESETTLLWFRDTYLSGMGYDHVVSIGPGDERGIENAVLSRFPLKNPRTWLGLELGGVHPPMWGNSENWEAGKPIVFRRSPLAVTVEAPGADGRPYEFTLFVVHHKSGGPGAYWREAESAKVVELIEEIRGEDPGANIAVLGDFNAQPFEKSVRNYTDAGFVDVFGDRTRPGEVPAELVTHESGRAIDLILVSPTMQPEVVGGSAFVLGTPARPEGADWRTTPAPAGYASDHYPVSIDLTPADR